MKMIRTLGPLTSFVIHAAIIVAIFTLVEFTTRNAENEIKVSTAEIETVDLEEFEKTLEEIEPPDDITDVFTDTPVDTSSPETESVAESQTSELDNIDVLDSVSPLTLNGMYKGRSAEGRAANSGKYGQNPVTEAAVMRALEWLRINQKPDGSWESSRPAGITGLGLLTFLAHGELPSSAKYGATVEKAIKYLLEKQTADGYFDKSGHNYSHAVATYAVSEAYAMTRIPTLRPAMEKGVARIVDGAQIAKKPKKGSMAPVPNVDQGNSISCAFWDYNYKKSGRHDLSFAGWQVQALKAAKLAGCNNEKLASTLAMAANGIKAVQSPVNGRFNYTNADGSGSDTMTGVGVLGLQLMGQGESDEVRNGLQALADLGCSFDGPGSNNMFYLWYYVTQAKFHKKGTTWKSWNGLFQKTLVQGQNKDGSWTNPKKEAHEAKYGTAYTTTLGALTLMVYYRNLPTFKEEALKSDPMEQVNNDGDVEVNIF